MSADRPPTIDSAAAARWQRLAQPASPWLHEEVARRMAQRLDWIVRQPASWLHWEPVRGGLNAQALLTRRYPKARCVVVAGLERERRLASEEVIKPWWHPARWRHTVQFCAQPAPAGADLLWANMTLHMASDPQDLMRRWHQALAVDGILMFSCFGPDTLRELRMLYQTMGWPAPAHEFTDMHDWGDMLLQAGFAEPVMDMERIELTFETPQRLLQELRELGRNLHGQRFAGLRGRRWHSCLLEGLTRLADPGREGRLKLTFEIIYGHAFKPSPRLSVAAETRFSVDELRSSLTKRKDPGSSD